MSHVHEAIQLFEDIVIQSNERITRELDEEVLKGISLELYEVLALLKIKGDKTPGEIAKFQNVKKSSMSNRLSKLFDRGLIAYSPSLDGDKRSKLVRITEEGLAIATYIHSSYSSVIANLFEDLDEDEDLITFIRVLKMIQGRLNMQGVIK